jgi:parallel beta-helix repeat protein
MKKPKLYLFLLLALFVSVVTLSFTSKATPLVDSRIKIFSNAEMDSFCSGNGTDGLTWDSAHIIENLEISGNSEYIPIWIQDTDRYLIIRNCTVYDGKILAADDGDSGIFLRRCSNVNVTDNDVRNTYFGIRLWSVYENITVTANYIRDVSASGISLSNGDNCTISYNTITDASAYGISLDIASNNEVFNNCIKKCGLGDIRDLGTNNNIYDNGCQGIPGFLNTMIIAAIIGVSAILVVGVRRKLKK